MSENPYAPPQTTRGPADGLGAVVFSCRDRSEKERLEALGQSLFFYFLLPLWLPIIPLGILVAALDNFDVKLSPSVFRGITALICVVTWGGVYWQMLRRPKKPSLVLHERGLRFKKTIVRFDDLASIRFGYKFSGAVSALVAANQMFGLISPRSRAAATMMEKTWEGSLTLVYKTGETKPLKAILIRPRPEDLKQFLERLCALRPGLLDDPPQSPSERPGLDDLSFKMRSI